MQPVLLSSFQQQQLTDENGMRTLYRAVDPSGQPVILCVFGSQASRNPEFRRLLKMDLQMLESLRHQAVPEFLGAGECEGCILTWQQDVDATTLHQLFQQGRVFSLEDIIEIGWQACSALQHAHNFGLSHGGLSDRCILLTDDLRVFVTDFGQPRWLAAVDNASVLPSPTAGRDATAALSRRTESPGTPTTESSTGVNNWRREVSGDLRSLARVLNAAIRREREMATASHAQSSPEIMGTGERTAPPPVEESGVSAHSLVRLLTRIEQHDEQAHPISARDFQGRLGEILIGEENDQMELLDQRENAVRSSRSIVYELFDDVRSPQNNLRKSDESAGSRWKARNLLILVLAVFSLISLILAALFS